MQNPPDVQLAAEALRQALPPQFFRGGAKAIGLILGTGLSRTAQALDNGSCGARVPFSAIPGFPAARVQSHEGAFVFGLLGDVPVLAQLGRCHLYEGRSPAEICMGVRVMGLLGIKTLIITNAAGALNPLFNVGAWMCMSDMINFTGRSALAGPDCEAFGDRFPDMSAAFDPGLRALAQAKALELGMALECGVYMGVAGPQLETPAETRMYRLLGADAIGMSTVLEVAAARQMGIAVLGFSCLTNKNLPDCMSPVSLQDVIDCAGRAGRQFERLLPPLCAEIAKAARPARKP